MTPLAIFARRALTPLEEIRDAAVVVEGSRIRAVGPRAEISVPPDARHFDAGPVTLVPGFVDVHIHGAGGHDFMEATPEALQAISAAVARFGATALVATTVSAPVEQTCRSLAGIADFIREQSAPPRAQQAEIVGIHLEGPFINAARRGVHPAEAIQPPSVATLQQFLAAAEGHARILTLAPELPGALELVDVARQAGLVAAMGHTDATYDAAHAAIGRGVRHAVHVFNAMRPFAHRETGVVGAVLTAPEVTAELIADGVHVDAPAMRLLLAAKGAAGVVLVSDGTAATGMPDGTYRLGSFEVTVAGGVCRNREGRLAGSTLTLDRALRTMVGLGVSLPDALRMLTLNPARLLGLDARLGVLAAGADANLVLLDDDLRVAAVMTRGTGLTG